jgi:PAS domain S-box-containing protein
MISHPRAQQFTSDLVGQALRAGGIVLWQWDLEANHITWSDNVANVLGWTSGVPSEFDQCVHPEDQARHQAALHRMLQDGQPYDIEVRFVRPDGRVIWLKDKGERQPGERVVSGVCLDITARKEAELT